MLQMCHHTVVKHIKLNDNLRTLWSALHEFALWCFHCTYLSIYVITYVYNIITYKLYGIIQCTYLLLNIY